MEKGWGGRGVCWKYLYPSQATNKEIKKCKKKKKKEFSPLIDSKKEKKKV